MEEKKGTEQSDLKSPDSVPTEVITFESDNQAEKKTIDADNLFYIEAASNYIKIFSDKSNTKLAVCLFNSPLLGIVFQ